MRRSIQALGVLAVLLSLLLTGCATSSDASVQDSDYQFVSPGGQTEIFYPVAQRKPIPDLSGESLLQQGQQIHISDFPNKVVVINIWGSWCGPCRTETPELEQVYRQTAASGVQVLGIDVKDDRSAAADFVQSNQLTYPSIYDFAGRSLLALNNYPRSVVPSTIVLDRQHRVAAVYLQPLNASDLLPEVQKLAAGG